MYAIIRAGGKQAKVRAGDVIEVERLKDPSETIELKPIFVVDADGAAHSGGEVLAGSTVTAKVLGEVKGDKIDIFKYKAKTGYRKRMGHRQTYTRLEITGIELPTTNKKATKTKEAEASPPADEEE